LSARLSGSARCGLENGDLVLPQGLAHDVEAVRQRGVAEARPLPAPVGADRRRSPDLQVLSELWREPPPKPQSIHWTGACPLSISSRSKLTAPDLDLRARTPCPNASLASSGRRAFSSVLALSCSTWACRVVR